MKKKNRVILGGVLFLLAPAVFASEVGIYSIFERINNIFYATITTMHLNYRENAHEANNAVPGDVVNRGLAYGVALDIRKVFGEIIYANVYAEYATGKIKYEGFEYFTFAPLTYKESHDFINADLKLGAVLLGQEYFQLIPYVGFGYHQWSLGGIQDNKYSHFKAFVGAKINFVVFDDWILSPYANIGTTVGPKVKFKKYSSPGVFVGSFKIDLVKKPIFDTGLEIIYKVAQDIFAKGTISYTHFEYGKAEIKNISIEPHSKTNEIRVGLGIGYSF